MATTTYKESGKATPLEKTGILLVLILGGLMAWAIIDAFMRFTTYIDVQAEESKASRELLLLKMDELRDQVPAVRPADVIKKVEENHTLAIKKIDENRRLLQQLIDSQP